MKSGFYFIEGMPIDGAGKTKPGLEEAHRWKPYKIWSGDKYQCNGCGSIIIAGFGHLPISIQHEPEFKETAEKLGANQFQVNDC
jgi:hypothetical protein